MVLSVIEWASSILLLSWSGIGHPVFQASPPPISGKEEKGNNAGDVKRLLVVPAKHGNCG